MAVVTSGAKPRWLERRLTNRPWYANPLDREYWTEIVIGTLSPVYWCLLLAGIIEVTEGDLWRYARIAPLGTPSRPWPEYIPKPWWLRWIR